jgi:hypothetical protein
MCANASFLKRIDENRPIKNVTLFHRKLLIDTLKTLMNIVLSGGLVG